MLSVFLLLIAAPARTVGFDGKSTRHDFAGKTHAISGEIRFDPRVVDRRIGGAVWIEASTLDSGDERFGAVLGRSTNGKHAAEELFGVRGVPAPLELKSGGTDGSFSTRLALGARREVPVPDWAFDPTLWSNPPAVKLVEPKKDPDSPTPPKDTR